MKSMPKMLFFMSSMTVSHHNNCDTTTATHPALFLISLGLECANASLKLFAFMQVIAAPMSNSQLNVFVPVVTLI